MNLKLTLPLSFFVVMCSQQQFWLILSSIVNLFFVVYLYTVTSTWQIEKASLERTIERLEQDNQQLVREVHEQETLHRYHVESLTTAQQEKLEEMSTQEVKEIKVIVPVDIEWNSFYLSMVVFVLINIGLFLCNKFQQ